VGRALDLSADGWEIHGPGSGGPRSPPNTSRQNGKSRDGGDFFLLRHQMMARLSPFFPAMLVVVWALLVAAGGLWASWRQSSFNTEIRNKNDEIAQLQRENANAISGGDSFARVDLHIIGADGLAVNAHAMPDELLLVPIIIHEGRYPLYDVTVSFLELTQGKAAFLEVARGKAPFDSGGALRAYPVGNLAPGLAWTSNIRLPHHGKDIEFNIFFAARNGVWTQLLRWRWIGDGWTRATKVLRGTQELHRQVAPNFPRQQDGSIDWGEPGAQDAAMPR